MSIFVMIYLILIDLGISTLILTPLTHFTYLFSISFGISLSHGILKSQRLRNSILPINNTDNKNPNGSYIEAKVLSTFLLVKHWLSVGINVANVLTLEMLRSLTVSLCLSQFNPSILVSFAFVLKCSFAKLLFES